MPEEYQVTVVGGGPAGLSVALYATRLGHDTAVIDRGGGRAAMMLDTHNVVGVTEDVSGKEFLATAAAQVEEYGGVRIRGYVSGIERLADGRFRVIGDDVEVLADRIVLATGFTDERPNPPLPRTGLGLQYCLHCDAYMFVDEPVYVMGHGESAARVAMILLNFTDEVDLLTRGRDPEWTDETDRQLRGHPVDVVHEEVETLERRTDGWLESFTFADGTCREYRGGFPMYGADYNTDLAEQLGCVLDDDGTISVDERGRTSVDGVYAVGDATPGPNQIPVALGEGARVGIALHTELREFPRSLDELERDGDVPPEAVPSLSERLREVARAHEGHAGGPLTDAPGADD